MLSPHERYFISDLEWFQLHPHRSFRIDVLSAQQLLDLVESVDFEPTGPAIRIAFWYAAPGNTKNLAALVLPNADADQLAMANSIDAPDELGYRALIVKQYGDLTLSLPPHDIVVRDDGAMVLTFDIDR